MRCPARKVYLLESCSLCGPCGEWLGYDMLYQGLDGEADLVCVASLIEGTLWGRKERIGVSLTYLVSEYVGQVLLAQLLDWYSLVRQLRLSTPASILHIGRSNLQI
jgi:hypothetical protein